MNVQSVELWTEYVKMELGYIEGIRRRWEVLGVEVENPVPADMDVDVLPLEEGDESQEALKEVMQGAVVKTVIHNAVKCKCTTYVTCQGLTVFIYFYTDLKRYQRLK